MGVKMKWNKVEDRVPREDYSVLIIDDMRNMFVGWLIDGKWHACDNCEFTIENVTHWREIPPFPYEPEFFSDEQDLMVRRAQTLVESLVEMNAAENLEMK